MRKPELLIPASSLEVLKTAVRFGADAVYIGGEAFSLRAKARNFSREDMAEGIAFAHANGVKVHVTANILAHNNDIDEAEKYFEELRELAPDALIISDPGMFTLAKKICPGIEIHISTQANNTNYMTFRFWHEMGAKRVVCARELSLAEIAEIRERVPEDLEGACTHPCRWKYAVMEESRPGEYLPVYENERGTFLFNSKDLCMIEHIPEMIKAGIDSFKIEGRMKTALYVATVARTYRKAIDDYLESEEKYRENMEWYKAEIAKCTYRQFTTGFYFGKPDENTQIYDSNTYVNEYIYLGMIEEAKPEKGLVRITQRNKFCMGDTIEIMKPSGENVEVKVEEMFDGEGNAVESAPHPQQEIWLRLSVMPDVQDILRVGNRKDAMPE